MHHDLEHLGRLRRREDALQREAHVCVWLPLQDAASGFSVGSRHNRPTARAPNVRELERSGAWGCDRRAGCAGRTGVPARARSRWGATSP